MKQLFSNKWMRLFLISLFILPISILGLQGCSDDEADNPVTVGYGEYVLIITNGAQIIAPDETLDYEAKLISEDGSLSFPESMTWSSSDENIITISTDGMIAVHSSGVASVTATATKGDDQYTATVPLKIAMPEIFAVSPPAMILVPGESVTLEPVFFTADAVDYSFASANAGVATVNGNGSVIAVAAGLSSITVTATNKNNAAVVVPILVVGIPEVALPVTDVKISPPGAELFRDDVMVFSAKAFNLDGEIVDETITWSSIDESVASVDAEGRVTALTIGETTIKATAKGMFDQVLVTVYPDTIVFIEPLMADVMPGNTFQFTARAYNIRNHPVTLLPGITQFEWFMPTWADFGEEFAMFDIGTIDQNGLLTVKPEAIMGMNSFVLAMAPGNEASMGVSVVIVGLDIPFP